MKSSLKLKRGEIVEREYDDGIIVPKWKGRRGDMMLPTCYNLKKVSNGKKNKKTSLIITRL